ncbi:MAG: hypothetical protein Q8L14_13545 [Myxococcales bacterium]|nr:hypothetical protein [Myxococcales bacterium]
MLGLVLTSFLHASPETFSFRGLSWGSSPEVAIERLPFLSFARTNENATAFAKHWKVSDLTTLVGRDEIDGTTAQLSLTFHKGRLLAVALVFVPPNERTALVDDFRRKFLLLEEKYGAANRSFLQCISLASRTLSEANCYVTPDLTLSGFWALSDTTITLFAGQVAGKKPEYAIRYIDAVELRTRSSAKDRAVGEKL